MGQEKGEGNRLMSEFPYGDFVDGEFHTIAGSMLCQYISMGEVAEQGKARPEIFRKRVHQWASHHGYRVETRRHGTNMAIRFMDDAGKCRAQCSGIKCGRVKEPREKSVAKRGNLKDIDWTMWETGETFRFDLPTVQAMDYKSFHGLVQAWQRHARETPGIRRARSKTSMDKSYVEIRFELDEADLEPEDVEEWHEDLMGEVSVGNAGAPLKDRIANLMEPAQTLAAREGFEIVWRLK